MSEINLQGGCLCGATRYQINDGPVSTAICHCRSCQRAAGAQSVAWAIFPSESFCWQGDAPAQFNSSKGLTRTFCATCGTTLTYQSSDRSIDVTLATLNIPERVAPTKEVWLSHRISWNSVDSSLSGFAQLKS